MNTIINQQKQAIGTREQGFSLVELMVSITIGLFLLAGAVTLFSNSKRTYVINDDLGRIQENARFAFSYLAQDLRMAGYFGCADNLADVNSHLNLATVGNLFDISRPVEGYDSNAPVADRLWQPSGNNDVAAILADNDGITVRYLQPSDTNLTVLMSSASADLNIEQPNDLRLGEVVAVSDCASTDIFQATAPAGPNVATLAHASGGGLVPGNSQNTLSRQYDDDAIIMRLAAYRYYVASDEAIDAAADDDNEADPVLVRSRLALNTGSGDVTEQPVQLIDGVEFMQITYGVDTDADRIPDDYIDAASSSGGIDLTTASGWDNVISARIALLLRSSEEVAPEQDTNDYLLNDVRVCEAGDSDASCDLFHPIDNRRRKVFTTTVLLRNLR